MSDNILTLLFKFLRNRKQRVLLKGQAPSLADAHVWIPHGSILDTLLFLIYINVLAGDLLNDKQFEADTLSFSVVYNVNTSADEVNNDLVGRNKWAYQWKWFSTLIHLNKLKK